MDARLHDILKEFRRGVEAIFGERLAKVVLFGSQARGDAREDSDVDVLVVLRGERTEEEADDVAAIESDLCLQYGVVISVVYLPLDQLPLRRTGLLRNIEREGVPL